MTILLQTQIKNDVRRIIWKFQLDIAFTKTFNKLEYKMILVSL
jgi:hypothetical protein